jgi:hypothetical protein
VSKECPAGCCPHDSIGLDNGVGLDDSASPDDGAAPDAGCPGDLPGAPLSERAVHLRNCRLLPLSKIAAATGADRELITRLLYDAVSVIGPRSGYQRLTHRAAEDDLFDRVMAHERERQALFAPSSRRGPSEVELLAALYADSAVRKVLYQHGVPVVSPAGTAWRRFPAPQPLTVGLVSDLYVDCGLGLHHIELLTGRPAAAAGAVLRAGGIKPRPAGGRSPFMERWRQGLA